MTDAMWIYGSLYDALQVLVSVGLLATLVLIISEGK